MLSIFGLRRHGNPRRGHLRLHEQTRQSPRVRRPDVHCQNRQIARGSYPAPRLILRIRAGVLQLHGDPDSRKIRGHREMPACERYFRVRAKIRFG